ncbi:MAG: 30S ribosomal protein S17 [Candidatus Dormibacteria bacterium]
MSPEAASTRPRRKIRLGMVVSDKMEKTVVVEVQELRAHRLYHKVLRRSHRFQAHDETNDCHTGDRVRIMETRPLSRTKRWRVIEIVDRAR